MNEKNLSHTVERLLSSPLTLVPQESASGPYYMQFFLYETLGYGVSENHPSGVSNSHFSLGNWLKSLSGAAVEGN